jgi:restriction system protein
MEGVSNGENQVEVKFLRNEDGDVAFIPRNTLSTALQSRLKLRMAIANFSSFKDELLRLVDSTNKGEVHTWKTEVERKEAEAEKKFKIDLLKRIQKGKEISLSAGGYGLEKLVKELLQEQGYEASIQAKNQSSGIDDIDIIAERANLLTSKVEVLFIQVKHHKGTTSSWGIEQLKAYPVSDDIDFYSKVLITTGKIDEAVKFEAEKDNIVILDGDQFVEWLYENIELLGINTKAALGIISIPSLV